MTDLKLVQHTWGHNWGPSTPLDAAGVGLCDLGFADPPYNIGVKYADDDMGDRLTSGEYRNLTAHSMLGLKSHVRLGGTIWWMVPEKHGDWVGQLLTEIVGPRVHRIIWHETFAQYQQKKLTEDYRFIFCHINNAGSGYETDLRRGLTFNPDAIRIPSDRQLKYKDKRANPAGRVPGQVWKVRRLQGTSNDHVDWHTAQLPPELLERIVLGWTNPGDRVMDAFAGSGNMGLACLKHGRHFVGVDKSPTYIQKMTERFAGHVAAKENLTAAISGV